MSVDAGFDLNEYLRRARGVARLLDQDQVWVDKTGRRHRIDEMSVRYKTNVLRFMRRRAKSLGDLYGWGQVSMLGQPSGLQELGGFNPETMQPTGSRSISIGELMGEAAHDDFDNWQDDQMAQVARDPVGWLDATPLMRRLSDDVINHAGGEDD